MADGRAVRVLLAVFGGGAIAFGGGVLAWTPLGVWPVRSASWVIAACAGIAAGVAAVLLIRASWRRHGGLAAIDERTRAVRTGRLPDGADRSWLPGLAARRQNAGQLRWALPAVAVLTTVLGIVHLGAQWPWPWLYWFLWTVALVALWLPGLRRAGHDRAVLDHFIAELTARPAD